MLNKNINDEYIFLKLNELVHTDIKKTILKKIKYINSALFIYQRSN